MTKLNQLEVQYKDHCEKGFKLRKQIEKLKLKKELPKLKKKFECKYWKCLNYSSGNLESWFIYSFCKEVTGLNGGIFDCFESTPSENKFEINYKSYFYLCETEISKDEYNKALANFKSEIEKL